MEDILKTFLIGTFFGTFGTTIGGIIGVNIKNNSNRFLGFILSFASGLMMAIICFDLIPEALEISSIFAVLLGIILGIITMIICDLIVQKKIKSKANMKSLLKVGIVVSIGLALHNIPEGLAIGTGFHASLELGLSLAIAIALHDVPEGISMAVPMKSGGMKKFKIIMYVIGSGLTTGIGALIGHFLGEISQTIIAISLSFAAGAMIYIVSGELIPEANNMYKGRIVSLGNILGLLLGIFVLNII